MALPSEGLAYVNQAGKRSFINDKGIFVTDFPIDEGAGKFSKGLTVVKLEKKWGFIDNTRKLMIQPQFDYAFGFSEGLAAVEKDQHYSFIDHEGRMLIPPRYSRARSYKRTTNVTLSIKLARW